jgi:hypothetical protein
MTARFDPTGAVRPVGHGERPAHGSIRAVEVTTIAEALDAAFAA